LLPPLLVRASRISGARYTTVILAYFRPHAFEVAGLELHYRFPLSAR